MWGSRCAPMALHWPAAVSLHPSIPSTPPSPCIIIPLHPGDSQHAAILQPHTPDILHPDIPIFHHPSTFASLLPHIPASWHPASPHPSFPAIPHAMQCQATSTKHPLLGNKLGSFVTLMKMELEQRGETHSLRSQVKCFNVKCAILLSLDRSHLMKAH